MISVATMCTGIGSFEQAMKELDLPHRIVFGCEIDRFARETYLANFEPETMYNDMTMQEWGEPNQYADMVCAGVPCQPFSMAGKRKGELDPRGTLFYDFYRYVKNQMPKVFIIENVKGLLSMDKGRVFAKWCEMLGQSVNGKRSMFGAAKDNLGYNLHYTVLNATDFGLPQNRERVFLVGIRGDLNDTFRFPKGWPLTKCLKDVLETNVSEKYYLSDKMTKKLMIKVSGNQLGYINQDTQASKVFDTNNIFDTLCSGSHGYAIGYIAEKNNLTRFGGQDMTISPLNGVSQTLSAGHFNQPKIIVSEATSQGYAIAEPGDSINISQPNSKTRRGRVGKGVANTIETQSNQVIIEPICVSMGGRNPDNPSARLAGQYQEQVLEPNSQGIANTITSVQKDNLIVEPILIEHRGHLDKSPKFIHNGIVPTLRAQSHGHETKVIEPRLIKEGQLPGFEQSGRVYSAEGVAQTQSSQGGGLGAKTGLYKVGCRIRRLTPLECGRLQGFSDDFIKPCSDTQLYRQFGNAIPVTMLKAIIERILPIIQ